MHQGQIEVAVAHCSQQHGREVGREVRHFVALVSDGLHEALCERTRCPGGSSNPHGKARTFCEQLRLAGLNHDLDGEWEELAAKVRQAELMVGANEQLPAELALELTDRPTKR
jgi:hypothetical protein